MSQKRATAISGLLVGDELGLVKRIEVHATPSSENVITLNRELINGEPTPDKSVLSIRPFYTQALATMEEDNDSDDDNPRPVIGAKADQNAEMSVLYLIASKPNNIYIYNSLTNSFTPVNPPTGDGNLNLVGAAPMNRNNIVVIYDNGATYLQNIEKELLESSADTKKKAIRLLGLDIDSRGSVDKGGPSAGRSSSAKENRVDKSNSSKKDSDQNKKDDKNATKNDVDKGTNNAASSSSSSKSTITNISDSAQIVFNPNWNTSNTAITCFEVCSNRLAIAGKNLSLKVFDLTTKQCIFTAKGSGNDWLGLKTQVYVSDVTWIGPILPPKTNPADFHNKVPSSPTPAMIATCSKTDPTIRIYDIKTKEKKPIWCINLKESTFNNDSNPPSFTTITSTCSPVTSAVPTQQLILGTTMGRMIAIDLRFNSRSHRQLGVFKGFGGGAIREISFVANCGSNGNHKVVSCSLDRFVRVHTFRTGANHKRQIDSKYYVKTRPTCVQPILSSYLVNDGESSEVDSMANVEDSDIECDDYDED